MRNRNGGTMENRPKKVEFYLGGFGKAIPLLTAAAMIAWAAFSQSNVNGYVIAFFAALVAGVLFAKDEKAYGEALVYGLGKPMFAVIVLSVVLAAISGKLISSSGAVQTIAAYVVAAGLTGRFFVAGFLTLVNRILWQKPHNCGFFYVKFIKF